ncbi:MAG: hypothetical protein AB7G65_19980 [Thermoleophilia bacterium]
MTAWPNPSSEILETVVWRRHQLPTPELRARGVTRRFGVYVIAHAWRGRAIDRALDRYVADPWTADAAPVTLPDGTRLAGGGGAHVVAYVGHNRWMDHRTPYRFPPETPDAPVKGAIAMACLTAPYVGDPLAAGPRVPLLLTRDFVSAGAGAFEGALLGLAAGADLAAIRRRAAAAYADSERKTYERVESAFTNPAHARWRPGASVAAADCVYP